MTNHGHLLPRMCLELEFWFSDSGSRECMFCCTLEMIKTEAQVSITMLSSFPSTSISVQNRWEGGHSIKKALSTKSSFSVSRVFWDSIVSTYCVRCVEHRKRHRPFLAQHTGAMWPFFLQKWHTDSKMTIILVVIWPASSMARRQRCHTPAWRGASSCQVQCRKLCAYTMDGWCGSFEWFSVAIGSLHT